MRHVANSIRAVPCRYPLRSSDTYVAEIQAPGRAVSCGRVRCLPVGETVWLRPARRAAVPRCRIVSASTGPERLDRCFTIADSIRPNVEIIPDKRRVTGLVEGAHEGKICLPNFQRDFVWTREEVADLVRSIVRGYFIGSLLLLRCDANNPPFAPVFLRGSNAPLNEPAPELLILDGQQRLSSLIYALTAPDLSLRGSIRMSLRCG